MNKSDHPTEPNLRAIQPIARSRFWQVIASTAVIGLALLAWGLYDAQQHPIPVAPSFTLTTYDNHVFRSDDLRGKVIVLNFWASWCTPCRTESPVMEKVWSEYQGMPNQSVVFLGVAQADTKDNAQAFLRDLGISYPNGANEDMVNNFGVKGLPTTFVIDRQGFIRDTLFSVVEPDKLKNEIDAALEQ